MRSYLRMLQTLAVAVVLFQSTLLRADDPPADEAASKRGAAVLEKMTAANEAYCGTTNFGLHAEGKQIGFISVCLKKGADGAEHAYEFSLEYKVLMGPTSFHQHETGTLDASFGLLSLKGEAHMVQGPAAQAKAYSIEIKDEVYVYTSKEGEAAATTTKVEAAIDSIDGIELLALKAWAALPAGEAHRFVLLNGEDGAVTTNDITASAARKMGEREVVDIKAMNVTKGKAAQYTCDAKTGEILEVTFDGAPFEVKPISAADLKTWQDANK